MKEYSQTKNKRSTKIKKQKINPLQKTRIFLTSRRGAIVFIAIIALIGTYVLIQSRANTTGLTYAEQATAGLDPSGKTIPRTNYAIPTGAIFMSPNGNDNNDGLSVNTPLRTINAAISKVPAGGTIVMRGGEYRDWARSPSNQNEPWLVGKDLTIQAYPGESPWFNGADIVSTGWTSDGAGRWSRDWATPSFCGNNYYTSVGGKAPYDSTITSRSTCMWPDAARDPAYPVAGNPQMVFVNDERLQEVNSLSQVTASTFYYDWATRKMFIGTDPNGKTVELAARPSALLLGGQRNYTIRGIGFKKYATNESGTSSIAPSIFTTAAVYIGGNTVTLENNVFTQMASNGLMLSGPKNGTSVKRSVFAFNGMRGMMSNGSSGSNARNDFLIDSNLFNANNVERYGLNCTTSCAAANLHLANMFGFVAKNNVLDNAYSRANGIWCDLDCREGVIVNNVARNNGGSGIFYEVSNNGIIASNVLIRNGQYGINVASANTKVYNNTIVIDGANQPLAQGISVYDDNRCPGCAGWNNVGPNTSNVELVNNIVTSLSRGVLVKAVDGRRTSISTNFTTATQYFSQFDYNAYHRTSSSELLYSWVSDSNLLRSSATFTSQTGYDANALDLSGGSSPYFNNPTAGDYRLKSGSPAINSGKPLPADVAVRLGVSANVPVNRGAFYPQSTPAPDTTPPSVPSNVRAVADSVDQVTVTWNASTDNVGVTRYELLRNGTSVSNSIVATSFVDIGLVGDTNYTYTLRAYDAAGNVSGTSAGVSVKTPTPPDTIAPSVPASLRTTTVSPTQVALAWNASTDNVGVTRYDIFKNGAFAASTSTLSYVDGRVSAGQTHTYTVRAFDAVGNSSQQSAALTVTVPVPTPPPAPPSTTNPTPAPTDTLPPTRPGNINATLRFDWSRFRYVYEIGWTASTDNDRVVRYEVTRDGVKLGDVTSPGYIDASPLETNRRYAYAVSAVDPAGLRSPQAAISVQGSCFLFWCSTSVTPL